MRKFILILLLLSPPVSWAELGPTNFKCISGYPKAACAIGAYVGNTAPSRLCIDNYLIAAEADIKRINSNIYDAVKQFNYEVQIWNSQKD